MDEGAKDSLLWIEEHLPERFELLLRTNREYDKRSGVHGGMSNVSNRKIVIGFHINPGTVNVQTIYTNC